MMSAPHTTELCCNCHAPGSAPGRAARNGKTRSDHAGRFQGAAHSGAAGAVRGARGQPRAVL